MDAIVLAGGYATRLWPVTLDRPKMFLPLGDSTVIDPIFQSLEDDDRIENVYVSTNERFAEAFETYLEGTSYEKPTLSIEETTNEDEKSGVIKALADLVVREGIDDDAIIIAGDNYISFDVSEFVDYFQHVDAPTIGAYDVGSPDRADQYGVIEVEDERVINFEEKPDEPDSSLVSIACYAFPAESIDLLGSYLAEENNPDEPGWFVQWLQDSEPTYAFTFDGAWFDIGTAESYLDAVTYELNGETMIAPSATVDNTTINGSVQIMEEAEVVDSTLEDTIVFPNATLIDTAVTESIIDKQAVLENVALTASVIGKYTTVNSPTPTKTPYPATHD